MEQRAGDCQALAHTSGESSHEASGARAKAAVFQRCVYAMLNCVQAVEFREEREVFGGRQIVVEQSAVAYETDSVLRPKQIWLWTRSFAGGDWAVREAQSSAAGIREERRDSQQSSLPCSVWAEERDKFAGEDFERDIAESGKGTETLLDGLERKA